MLLTAFGVAGLPAPKASACPRTPTRFDEAVFQALAGLPPAEAIGDAIPVALPDAWGRTRPGQEGHAVYRLDVAGERTTGEPCAIYLPEVNPNAAVFVNGNWVGQGGRMTEPVAHNFNRPMLVELSPALFVRGDNVVEVVMRGFADGATRLGPVWLGPASELAERHRAEFARGAGLAQASTLIALLASLVVGALWIAMRFESSYAWFLVAASCWTFASLNHWLRDPPVSHWTWERLMNGALDQTVVIFIIWAHRLLGVRAPGGERVLWGASAGLAAIAAFTPRSLWPQVVLLCHGVALGLGALLVIRLARYRERLPRTERTIYTLGGTVAVALCGWDLSHYVRQENPLPPLLPVALSVSLGTFGLAQVLRFARSTREVSALNADLDRRVSQREAELAGQFERLRELERQEILATERERMMRDLHDGLGGRIVSALSLAESGHTGKPVVEVLRDALDEMRMVIDSLDPHLADLPSLLGQVRARLAPVLEDSGVRLRWEVAELPETPDWGSARLLDVLRIVQEAITNALRHAHAREITLWARRVGGTEEIEIAVQDDGRGIEGAVPGRGLRHMEARAESLGGRLSVEACSPGTRVGLRMPLWPESSGRAAP